VKHAKVPHFMTNSDMRLCFLQLTTYSLAQDKISKYVSVENSNL